MKVPFGQVKNLYLRPFIQEWKISSYPRLNPDCLKMFSLLKFALFFSTLALASVIPCGNQVVLDAVAVAPKFQVPSGFWQIYKQDTQRSTSLIADNGTATFAVSQDDKAANKLDLVATFTNIPNVAGPFQFQFFYSNPDAAGYISEGNTPIYVYTISGALPVRHNKPLPAPGIECKRRKAEVELT